MRQQQLQPTITSTPQQQQQQQDEVRPQDSAQQQDPGQGSGGVYACEPWSDYTQVPTEMNEQFEALDKDGLLRPTIINPGDVWTKKAQKALLGSTQTSMLTGEEQASEKQKAFDLLDALTRSGALNVQHASLHVVLAATHCFDKSILDTAIQDNVSPIEKVEHSTLIMASTLQRIPAEELVQPTQLPRLKSASPMLFPARSLETL